MELTVKVRAELERDIQRMITDMGYFTGTAKAELRARRRALAIVRNAYATVIADDLLAGHNPRPELLNKYRTIKEWLSD